MSTKTGSIVPKAEQALTRATDKLKALQHPAGWWKAELETNVTMDAEDLMLRRFLDIDDEERTQATANWIRSQQLADGGWAIFHGGDSDLSATIEAYVALRLAGDPVDADHMKAAAYRVRERGGIAASRVFTRIWLALFGEWSWADLPALPPEVILLPAWFPLNVYDFACWARQTIVPLTVVAAHRPQRQLGFSLDELRVQAAPVAGGKQSAWARAFHGLDRFLHLYEKRPIRWLRRRALRQCTEWIVRRQEADGSWGGIQPPWVYSLMALHLQGYADDHPVVRRGLEGLDTFVIEDERGRRLEACQSPVWDSCLAMVALHDAGVDAADDTLLRGADWLLGQEIRVPGDWAVRRPSLAPGGWAFEFENDNYPDLDDTAEVVLALHGVASGEADRAAAIEAAIDRAITWTLGMQCEDGGYAAFDVDNTSQLCGKLPFCDFGEVTDPPSADVTAHVVEMLATLDHSSSPATRRAVDWLLAAQEADGSWFGRWGANYIYGTGAVVPALVRAGQDRQSAPIRRAVQWLQSVQNADGGWGEDLRSYVDRRYRGRGESTPSQTAWALLALLAAGGAEDAVECGVTWLASRQLSDGDWQEEHFTGTGFPGDFYIRYHLYRLVFPTMALGRYLREEKAAVSGR